MQFNGFFTSGNYLKRPQDLRQREQNTPSTARPRDWEFSYPAIDHQ